MILRSAGAGESDHRNAGFALPGEIRIARDGTWFHEGGAIRRKRLVKLFASVLRREPDGGYALVTPAERVPVIVEDVPFVVEEMERRTQDGRQVLSFRSNIDEWVEAGPEHPIRVRHVPDTGEPSPYIRLKNGLDGRIVRSVFYRVAELAEPGPDEYREIHGVWSRGTFFPLEPR